MTKPDKLTKRDRALLDDFASAAKHWGWQEDQGYGNGPARAEESYLREYKALERRLSRKCRPAPVRPS